MFSPTRLAFTLGAGVLAFMTMAPHSKADPVANFYNGKTITLTIGYGAGGGYDRYGRLLARYIGRHIPGNPSVIAQNMPGAGSLRAANYIYATAPADGTAMALFGPGIAFEPLRGGTGVQFDPKQFGWLGSMNEQVGLVVSMARSGFKTLDDARQREVFVGASGSGSSTNLNAHVMNAFVNTNFRVIRGYAGSNDILLAMERGEVDAIVGWSWDSIKASRPQWLDNPDVNIVMQIAEQSHPEIAHIPNLFDQVSNEEDKKVLQLIFAHQLLGRPFVMPPGVPEPRLRAVRQAFDAAMKDADLLDEARRTNVELSHVSAERIERHLEAVFGMPEPLVARAAEMVQLAVQRGEEAPTAETRQ